MILRFSNAQIHAEKISALIRRACAGLSREDFALFGELQNQFHVQDDLDLFIDDNMDPEYRGIILKALRAHGYLEEKAEIIVPARNMPLRDHVSIDDPAEKDRDNIAYIEDYIPDEAFTDGNFWEEMFEIWDHTFVDDEE